LRINKPFNNKARTSAVASSGILNDSIPEGKNQIKKEENKIILIVSRISFLNVLLFNREFKLKRYPLTKKLIKNILGIKQRTKKLMGMPNNK
jgi:hypothetical protein